VTAQSIASSDWALHDGKETTNTLPSMFRRFRCNLQNLVRPGSTPRIFQVLVTPNGERLQYVMDLLSNNTIQAVIDRTFPLDQASAAFQYLEQGHANGKVVIDLSDNFD
jgi:NADPH:quinone reductase-like Zn-dependent oxidoreductase